MSDGDDHLQCTTRSLPDVHRQLGHARVPGLTILCHPDPERVGEEAALTDIAAGKAGLLSRLEPHFGSSGGGPPHPLADPHLSRKPLRFTSTPDGGVHLDPSESSILVTADGAAVSHPIGFRREKLEHGVVLLLNRRVTLLLHSMLPAQRRPPTFGLIGENAAMIRLRQEIQRLAGLKTAVLLRGESGTGKELVARALHQAGPRRQHRCVCVNMGGIPSGLAAAELFGTAKGAFTGATRRRSGHFLRADGGTLFLDEVGDASADVQVLLLRALETNQIQPLGAADPVSVDVRLISATDVDLEAAMDLGDLRSSLFHRLAGYELELPPLRSRRDDIGRLFFHFLRQEITDIQHARERDPDLEDCDLSDTLPAVPAELVARLAAYPWPGNVRELRNVVGQLVIASLGEAQLRLSPNIERRLRQAESPKDETLSIDRETPVESAASYRQPNDFQESELHQALRDHRWNVQGTATALNVTRTSLYRWMRKCPRVRRASDLSREEMNDAIKRTSGRLDAMVELLEVSKRGLQLRMSELGLRTTNGGDT